MDRWAGILKIKLHPNSTNFYRIAASLKLSSSETKSFCVPSGNAIFFTGDRVEGTGNPMIDKLSDPLKIAEILVSKYGPSINAFVVEAPFFNGPFAVYEDLIPSVNEYGEPKSYDASEFPASTTLVLLLSKFLSEAKGIVSGKQSVEQNQRGTSSESFLHHPRTAILGFSKGGTVLNQLLTEFSMSEIQIANQENKSAAKVPKSTEEDYTIVPTSRESLFNTITEVHYVDVGLNTEGAYLTDKDSIDRLSERLSKRSSGMRFLFHGTPRQWCDRRRTWIRREKDDMVGLLKNIARRNIGKVKIRERMYFPGKVPDLQMHFEIIEAMDVEN